jgi:hypothetical protein
MKNNIKDIIKVQVVDNFKENEKHDLQDSFDIDAFFTWYNAKITTGETFSFTTDRPYLKNEVIVNSLLGDDTYLSKSNFMLALQSSSESKPIELIDGRFKYPVVKVEGVDNDVITYKLPINGEDVELKANPASLVNSYFKNGEFFESDEIFPTNKTIKVGDFIGIDIGYAEINKRFLIEIECIDGYFIVGLSTDELTVIDTLGNKNYYVFEDLYNNGALGQYIYHIEEIDGICYEFASKIKNIKEIQSDAWVNISNTLNDKQRYCLSLENQNINHKVHYIYDKSNEILMPL